MKGKFGIIGKPLTHSVSPLLFEGIFKLLKLDYVYIPFQLNPDEIISFLDSAKMQGFTGINVTSPYKEIICNFLDDLDEHAGKIKAVNTILFTNGKTIGFNTDFFGFSKSIDKLKDKIKKFLILGGGGAARAVLYAISELKYEKIFLMERNPQRRKRIGEDFSFISHLELVEWKEEQLKKILGESDFVINATPVGMKGMEISEIFSINYPSEGKIFVDLIYNPPITPFLQQAKNCGAKIKNGLDMLIYQAMKSLEIWTGIKTKEEDWRRVYNSVSGKSGGLK